MVNYTLDVFSDGGCSQRVRRLSLSADSDARATGQAERERDRCEMAGESRVLVLSLDGREIARFGSRRFAPGGYAFGDSPLYTFDCAWCCGVDLLKARHTEVDRVPMAFRDFPRDLTAEVDAAVLLVDEVNPFGERLRGHAAVAGYHGGWLVWLADDLTVEPCG